MTSRHTQNYHQGISNKKWIRNKQWRILFFYYEIGKALKNQNNLSVDKCAVKWTHTDTISVSSERLTIWIKSL